MANLQRNSHAKFGFQLFFSSCLEYNCTIMTAFLIASQVIVFMHIAFGELTGAMLLWSVKELVYLSADRIKWLKMSLWVSFGSVMLAWVAGGSYYLFLYPQVKAVINTGPETWGHLIFTESKEHIFFFLPVMIFVAAVFAQKRGHSLLGNVRLKRNFTLFVILTALLVFAIAFMGYMITWSARTALWVNSGL